MRLLVTRHSVLAVCVGGVWRTYFDEHQCDVENGKRRSYQMFHTVPTWLAHEILFDQLPLVRLFIIGALIFQDLYFYSTMGNRFWRCDADRRRDVWIGWVVFGIALVKYLDTV